MKENSNRKFKKPFLLFLPVPSRVVDVPRESSFSSYYKLFNNFLGWILTILAICMLFAAPLFVFYSYPESTAKRIPFFLAALTAHFPGLLLLWHSTQNIEASWASNKRFRKYLKIACWVTGIVPVFLLMLMPVMFLLYM